MKTIYIIIIILLALFGIVFVLSYFSNNSDSNRPQACTEEAKLCSDGSAVGRIGPGCEFEKCPDENNNQIVGGDKDEHGCIGSAGYVWSEEKQECIREWEETLKQECINLGCGEDNLFVGSINSDKYYNCDCRYAQQINSENIICFKTDEEALNDERVKSEC